MIKEVLIVEAPRYPSSALKSFTSKEYECAYCNGRGSFMDMQEEDTVPCPLCEGKGKVRATITLEWRGSDE